jgi:hypothetical protein
MKEIFGDDRHGGCEFRPLKALKSKLPLLLGKDVTNESRCSMRIDRGHARKLSDSGSDQSRNVYRVPLIASASLIWHGAVSKA